MDGLQLRLGDKSRLDDPVTCTPVLPSTIEALPLHGRSVWVQLAWSC